MLLQFFRSKPTVVHLGRVSAQDKKTFLLQEHSVLTKEIADQLAELWTIEKLAIGGSAALAAWLATHSLSTDKAWWLPFLFIAGCALRFGLGMLHIVKSLARRVQAIEVGFLGRQGGYESWFREGPLVQTFAHSIVWVAALVISLYAALHPPLAVEVGKKETPAVSGDQTPNPSLQRTLPVPSPGQRR